MILICPSRRRQARGESRAVRLAAQVAGPILLATVASAHAHTGGQAFILLLPTHLYIAGGAIVVAASFVLLALVPARVFDGTTRLRLRVPVRLPASAGCALSSGASLASLILILVLVAAGAGGSRDPLANPLTMGVWTVWWIGLAYAHAVLGNLWAHVNPWSGFHRIVTMAPGLRRWRAAPPLPYPQRAGQWPAVAFFLAFAWFELIHPRPTDPAVLAGAVLAYLLVHAAGVVLFGGCWLASAEAFSVFFRMLAWMAPLAIHRGERGAPGSADRRGDGPARTVEVCLPALKLLAVEPLPPGGVAFVLLALASVSFDGFSRTFTWLGWLGVNPLDHPGRTALMGRNTLGLLATFALFVLAYASVAALAGRLGGFAESAGRLRRTLVVSIVPIAVAYHVAHSLPVFLVDVQYAARAASDPFALGWNLFGTRDLAVIASFLTDPARVYAIWHTQVALIVAGHVAAVWVAHARALRLAPSARAAVASQLPLTVLMVAYTMLGLWLLSAPTAG